MLLPKPLIDCGDLRGTIYDFQRAGDILPKHNHTEDNVHITVVARGRFKVYSHDWEMNAATGQVLNFEPNNPHEFMALEDNSRIVNIVKKMGGTPNDTSPYVGEEQ